MNRPLVAIMLTSLTAASFNEADQNPFLSEPRDEEVSSRASSPTPSEFTLIENGALSFVVAEDRRPYPNQPKIPPYTNQAQRTMLASALRDRVFTTRSPAVQPAVPTTAQEPTLIVLTEVPATEEVKPDA